MKRLWAGLGMLTILLGGPALADTLVTYPTSTLKNSSPATEQAWLVGLLAGIELTFVSDVQNPSGNGRSLTNFNPGVDWDYAVVKYSRVWAVYTDSFNDNLLTVGPLLRDISHVDFFRKPGPPPVRVPEPSALLLLGTGLMTVVPFVWSRRRSE